MFNVVFYYLFSTHLYCVIMFSHPCCENIIGQIQATTVQPDGSCGLLVLSELHVGGNSVTCTIMPQFQNRVQARK